MGRDILSEYGPESSQPQAPRASGGGKQTPKLIPYDPPKGPASVNDPQGPGLHGENYGNAPTQGRH